jgi:hypothetical protein
MPIVNVPLLPAGLAEERSVDALSAHRVVDDGAVTLMDEPELQAASEMTVAAAANIRKANAGDGRHSTCHLTQS